VKNILSLVRKAKLGPSRKTGRFKKLIKQAAKVLSEDAALLKRVQIYLCHKFSGQKLKDIGSHFGIGVSGVSQASRRVGLQIKNDKKLKKKIDKIILDLDLSTV
jgi:chromosomal replication initiation ATPase DnaA